MDKGQFITREKHLDHLVRVVPLLCLAYGVQSYFMFQYAAQGNGSVGTLVMILGASLALSVTMLVFYDQRHRVVWNESGFTLRLPWSLREYSFKKENIHSIEVVGEPEEFQTVIVTLNNRKSLKFFFVDNGHEFKASMDTRHELSQAA